jgi:hypothetical protein
MAVRQQQRRGTAAQWTAANPILSAAEIGVEIDTNKFKIGDGTNRWADLVYFTADAAAAINELIDGAPDLLNTLNELAAAIGDDANFVTTMTTNLAAKAPLASPTFTGTVSGVTKAMVGLGNVDNTSDASKPVSTATQAALDLKANSADITELSQDAVNTALTAGTGITKTYNDSANTITVAVDSTIATKTYADGKASDAQTAAASDATTKANNAKSGAETTAANALASHEADTTNIHGIADTSALATKTYADNAASTAVAAVVNSAPEALNTLKELADALTADESTAASLATLAGTKAPSANPTFTGTVQGITKSMVGLGNVDNTSDANKPVSTAAQTALDLKAPIANPTFTGTVAGITKSMVGLGSVDNTADTAKPVSTSQATAIATAKSEAITAAGTAADTKVSNAVAALTKSSVGLGNVDNTSDANKPVSSATQTALDLKLASVTAASTYETISNVALKAPLASPALTGTPTAPTASYSTDSTQLATTAFVKSVLNNIGSLNLVLDGGGA